MLRRDDDADLAVKVRPGDTSSTPVLLVHGMGGDHSTWRRLARSLRDRTVVAVDLRGHGRSDRSRFYRLDDFRDDLGFVTDRLDLGRVDVVAHSLGAHTALRFAMAHPDRVGAMVLEEPPPMPRDAADLAEEITQGSDVRDRVRGLVALGRNPAPYVRFDRVLPDAVNAQFRHADPGWWEGLGDIEASTLVVSGGDRSFLPPRHLESLAGALPRSGFTVLESGHSVHRDRPHDFARLVRRHLSTAD